MDTMFLALMLHFSQKFESNLVMCLLLSTPTAFVALIGHPSPTASLPAVKIAMPTSGTTRCDCLDYLLTYRTKVLISAVPARSVAGRHLEANSCDSSHQPRRHLREMEPRW